jgi:DNA gyrase subunit B
MRQTLMDLGLDGTTLSVYDTGASKPVLAFQLSGAKLREAAELLETLAEKVHTLRRRGLDFADMMAQRKAGRLPTHWIIVDGQDIFCYSQKEFDEKLKELTEKAVIEEAEDANGSAPVQPKESAAQGAAGNGAAKVQKKAELHEMKEIEKLIDKIKKFGISIEDYYLVREESVTGEKEPAKYVLNSNGDVVEVDGVAGVVPGIRELGGRGMEIKRFKGLGEMNDDQLWETTMDPQRRLLLRVKAEDAEEAETMFSVLMGNDVERRREFIEKHALEVKNLDV